MKKTELLAPAGCYEALVGAINAGADAVYLGGDKFGARAYAGNFSEEELVAGLRYAHLFGKKIYLTLNTLIKEKEYPELGDFLQPFYEEGLDGIIIQDVGVMEYVHNHFPLLPVHVSTQAFVTGPNSAKFYKRFGAVRVVPARELSLKEMVDIKDKTGLEIESFIHGAMCYCYSGQCLFSSIVGGRSGNRGRCAQPCRLPYKFRCQGKTYFDKENYPLSLKDMCTIYNIPKLIDAGIDSFKIEGRMKKPEYVAGVTAIYRKYIDMYCDNPNGKYEVSKEDQKVLENLYIRSQIQNGYYFKHNGADMITINSPAYSPTNEALLSKIRDTYLKQPKKAILNISAICHEGKPFSLTMECNEQKVTLETDNIIEVATGRPATLEDIKKNLCKLGNTDFTLGIFDLDLKGSCFVPVKIINDLRRSAIEELSNKLKDAILIQRNNRINEDEYYSEEVCRLDSDESCGMQKIQVFVSNEDQLKAACEMYDYSQFTDIIISYELAKSLSADELRSLKKYSIYLSLPYILRNNNMASVDWVSSVIDDYGFEGVLVNNPEELQILFSKNTNTKLILNYGLYGFNYEAVKQFSKLSSMITLPVELNSGEKRQLISEFSEDERHRLCVNIYGRIPMMLTANCVYKTAGLCKGKISERKSDGVLIDRLSNEFPVKRHCEECMNVIYNCVPLSAHKFIRSYSGCSFRLDFTYEDYKTTKKVIELYNSLIKGELMDISEELTKVVGQYTTGHEKRGVE